MLITQSRLGDEEDTDMPEAQAILDMLPIPLLHVSEWYVDHPVNFPMLLTRIPYYPFLTRSLLAE